MQAAPDAPDAVSADARLGGHERIQRTSSERRARAAGFSGDGGSDISEILVTAAAIPEGDEAAWMREWKARQVGVMTTTD